MYFNLYVSSSCQSEHWNPQQVNGKDNLALTVGCKSIHPLGILPLTSIIGLAPKPSCHYTGSLCIIIKISQSYDSHS